MLLVPDRGVKEQPSKLSSSSFPRSSVDSIGVIKSAKPQTSKYSGKVLYILLGRLIERAWGKVDLVVAMPPYSLLYYSHSNTAWRLN